MYFMAFDDKDRFASWRDDRDQHNWVGRVWAHSLWFSRDLYVKAYWSDSDYVVVADNDYYWSSSRGSISCDIANVEYDLSGAEWQCSEQECELSGEGGRRVYLGVSREGGGDDIRVEWTGDVDWEVVGRTFWLPVATVTVLGCLVGFCCWSCKGRRSARGYEFIGEGAELGYPQDPSTIMPVAATPLIATLVVN